MAANPLLGLVASLVPGIPGGALAQTAITGAANALIPASPETEARFAQLLAGWSAVELRINALPQSGGLPGAKDVLSLYRQWTAFRDAWLRGQKDGSRLPAQEGALKRVADLLDSAPGNPLPPLTAALPAPVLSPDRPRRRGPSLGVLALGAAVLVGATAAVAVALKK